MATPRIAILLLTLNLLSAPALVAQEGADQPKPPRVEAPAAPLPGPLLNAKTAFIGFAGGDADIWPDHFSGGPDRAYNQLYAALQSWGRYQLVTSPAEADLIMELHFSAPMGLPNSLYGEPHRLQFRLVIFDAKTHATVWSFIEYLYSPNRKGTHDQRFDAALTDLVNDLKTLTTRTNPTSQPASPSGVAQ